MLIESRLASGKKRGYLFTLSGCGAAPNSHFLLTARPTNNPSGRVFCTDETNALRASANTASCQSQGVVLP